MIIGLSGYAQAGKDTTAQILVEDHGFTRIAFADIIRAALYRLDPIVSLDGTRLGYLVEMHGWDNAKQLPEVRRLLQVMGTEVGRELIDPQIWIELTMNGVNKNRDIVISDVRFKNEAEEIKFQQGQVWRISRIDKGAPVNAHRSENEMDTWNFDEYVSNNGTIDDLRKEIGTLIWKA